MELIRGLRGRCLSEVHGFQFQSVFWNNYLPNLDIMHFVTDVSQKACHKWSASIPFSLKVASCRWIPFVVRRPIPVVLWLHLTDADGVNGHRVAATAASAAATSSWGRLVSAALPPPLLPCHAMLAMPLHYFVVRKMTVSSCPAEDGSWNNQLPVLNCFGSLIVPSLMKLAAFFDFFSFQHQPTKRGCNFGWISSHASISLWRNFQKNVY